MQKFPNFNDFLGTKKIIMKRAHCTMHWGQQINQKITYDDIQFAQNLNRKHYFIKFQNSTIILYLHMHCTLITDVLFPPESSKLLNLLVNWRRISILVWQCQLLSDTSNFDSSSVSSEWSDPSSTSSLNVPSRASSSLSAD